MDKAGTKKEGAFYLWTEEEVKEVLGQHAPMFITHYYIKPQGNADLSPRSDPHHEFRGLNCLRQAQSLQETAGQAGVSEEEAQETLAVCRKKLHERRGKRPRPHLDDKVIAGFALNQCRVCTNSAASRADLAQGSETFMLNGKSHSEQKCKTVSQDWTSSMT